MSDHATYLFFRAKRSAQDKDTPIFDAAGEFEVAFGCALDMVGFGPDGLAWDDGAIFRCVMREPVTHVFAHLRTVLDEMESWIILRPGDDALEFPQVGLIKGFQWASGNALPMQIYLLAKDGDRSFQPSVEEIRQSLKSTVSNVVFDFADGAVIFAASSEPLKITARRCARALRRFQGWAFIGSDGETFSEFNGAEDDIWADAPEVDEVADLDD